MVEKTDFKKLGNSKTRRSRLNYFDHHRALFICLNILCTVCPFFSLSCQDNPSTSASPTQTAESPFAEGNKSFSNKNLENNEQCDELANRIDELNSLILRQEQTAKQASEQAGESCRGDSAIDCGFWTERANNLTRKIRELRRKEQKLEIQREQSGCP